MRNGRNERLIYSLSRWTDLPAAKWAWFRERLKAGFFFGGDPRTGCFWPWRLTPEATLGLVFWTRDPSNLIKDRDLLKDFPKVVHFTLTGWQEVEKGSPTLEEGLGILGRLVDAISPESVTWRFSPIPLVPDALDRFGRIAEGVRSLGVSQCYLAFLQTNEFLSETRSLSERVALLGQFAEVAGGLDIRLCNEDSTLREAGSQVIPYGVCEDAKRFEEGCVTEGCGCALAVDPFTDNEACVFGCSYCYAANKDLAPRKRNTTRGLPVLR